MHRNTFVLASAIACVLLSRPAGAENLLEVYQHAVQSDPLIREAEARREAALEVKPQARGLLLPQINIDGQWAESESDSNATFTQARDTPPFDIVIVNNQQQTDQDAWNYQAEATQTLFRWDQWQALKRADSQVALAEANYRAAQQDLLLRVSQAYFDVLAAEDTLSAADATLQAVTRQLEQAEKRFEVGLIAITDVQEARAAHDSATAAVIAAKRALATAHEALRELTGEAYQTLIKPGEEMPLDQPQPADEETWVTQALEQNLNVIAARLGVDVAKRNVKIAQAGHLPSVDLFANRTEFDSNGTQINQIINPLGPPEEGPSDSDQTDETYGIRVNIPILAGGATQSRVREQVHLHRAERERLEGAIRRAERDTRDAYLGVLAEKARVTALNQSVKSNQTALEATEAGFEVGTRP